jgi:predicted methyltransferase
MKHVWTRLLAAMLLLACHHTFAAPPAEEAITKALAGAHRSAANRARDVYRHPKETLRFFGLEPHMHVVEVTPGNGWYTEVLAPVLRDQGLFYAAHFHTDEEASPFQHKSRSAFLEKLAKNPQLYDKVIVTSLRAPEHTYIAPRGSVDMVLTFRNVHNWAQAGTDEATFKAFHDALKPGGILGVVEHRARPGTSEEDMKRTGYMTESYVIQLAHRAGFRFVEKSEVNANPKDTADWARGVWTLPPTLLGGDENRAKYLAVGESDRMTIKFVKPR